MNYPEQGHLRLIGSLQNGHTMMAEKKSVRDYMN